VASPRVSSCSQELKAASQGKRTEVPPRLSFYQQGPRATTDRNWQTMYAPRQLSSTFASFPSVLRNTRRWPTNWFID
jgi:hypothetical protein